MSEYDPGGFAVTRRTPFTLCFAAALLLLAGCGSTGSSTASSSTPVPTPTPEPVLKTATATVAGNSKTIITNASGMTLYYYTPDKGTGQATCTGACLAAWPPALLPSGVTKPTGDKGVTGALGTVSSPAGGSQVTYNGWPLYTWVKDKAPGDTTGQGVGGKWFVATPDVASGS
jgi:predicted lipoprotein with Yx(FWY)xxD motif